MKHKNIFSYKSLLPKKKNYSYPLLNNGLNKNDLNQGVKVLKSGKITMAAKEYTRYALLNSLFRIIYWK